MSDETTSSDYDGVAAELATILDILTDALNVGVGQANGFFADERQLPDTYLHPALVRWYAKRYLNDAGTSVSDDMDAEFSRDELANNGLLVSYRDVQIRVLKSDDGELPVPGRSRVKQAFYNQQLAFRFTPDGETSTFRLNLVLLWDVDHNFNLSSLVLVMPGSGGLTRASVDEYWRTTLPVPLAAPLVVEPEPLMEDLPITVATKEDAAGQKPIG
jgi:hypothetical protein